MKCAILILCLSTYTTAFNLRDVLEFLDYDEIKNDIVDNEKSRNVFTEVQIQDDLFEEEFGQSITKTIQKRDLNNKKQYLYNTDGNNTNGNNLKWYSCSTGLVVQLRRTGLNSTNNTNNLDPYRSIYNYFVQNLNYTNNPYNIKNNTIIKGYYDTYKVVRAYRPKNYTNSNNFTNNPKNNQMNATLRNSTFNNERDKDNITRQSVSNKENNVNTTYYHINNEGNKNNMTYNHINNKENKSNTTYNHINNEENKNNLLNNPDGTVKKKSITYECSIVSSVNCPTGFKKIGGYCIPDPGCYVESEDYQDYDFDFTE